MTPCTLCAISVGFIQSYPQLGTAIEMLRHSSCDNANIFIHLQEVIYTIFRET
jgi:hypothetical protein